MQGPPGDLTLELRRIVAAPPPAAFAAFTDPARLVRWWGPEGFSVPAIDFSARVGERYRITMQPPDGEPFHLTGTFRAVEPPTRLDFTFAWEPPDPDDVETLACLTFAPADGGTEIVLMQGPFRTEARRALHRDGWTESLDRLEAELADRA